MISGKGAVSWSKVQCCVSQKVDYVFALSSPERNVALLEHREPSVAFATPGTYAHSGAYGVGARVINTALPPHTTLVMAWHGYHRPWVARLSIAGGSERVLATPTSQATSTVPVPGPVLAPQSDAATATAEAVGAKERELFALALRNAAMGVQASSAPPPAPVPHSNASQQAHLEMQKQQRLLQLLHAQECLIPLGGGCVMTNCELFKQSLPHYMSCQDGSCAQRHCASSRFCLTHWASCSSATCEVCPEVNRKFGRSTMAQEMRNRILTMLQQHPQMQPFAGVKRAANHDAGGSDDIELKRARMAAEYSVPSTSKIIADIRAGVVQGMSPDQWDAMTPETQANWLQRLQSHHQRLAGEALAKRQQQSAPRLAAAPPAASTATQSKQSAKNRIDGDCTLIATMSKVTWLR
jgi:hypothetical protein